MDETYDTDYLTEEEANLLERAMGHNYPQEEEKQNIFSFFKRVITMKSNTRTANLNEDEMGRPIIPVRTNQEIALYCTAMGMGAFSDYFKDEAQILLGTSLSREGFLDKLAVTQKRESEWRERKFSPAQKKNWFSKKSKQPVSAY